MPRDEVRKVMPVESSCFRKGPNAEHETDSYLDGFHVYYRGREPTVAYIELCNGLGLQAVYQGISVFEVDADDGTERGPGSR
jgi:hypothetical protein